MSSHAKLWVAALFSCLSWSLGGCANPIVGAECRPGLNQCGRVCVDLATDHDNCGGCGLVCGGGQICISSTCVGGGIDAGPPDAARIDAGPRDGGMDADLHVDGSIDVGVFDVGTRDAGDASTMSLDAPLDVDPTDAGPRCGLGELLCGSRCVRPLNDRNHCGSCDNECGAGEFCAGGVCDSLCEPPLNACGMRCVDHENDPNDCGICGRTCGTGICLEGNCTTGVVGRVVLVGHDYTSSRVGMNRIAGNAVFLAEGSPVNVLVYEGAARAASISGTDGAINQVAAAIGRVWVRTEAEADRVPFLLASANVFVIYSQHDATNSELRKLGEDWGLALVTFLRRGGVLVLFDAGGTHNGTYQILTSSGIFVATNRTDISGQVVDLVATSDGVALGVPLNYLAESASSSFTSPETQVVVNSASGPVVIHRSIAPP